MWFISLPNKNESLAVLKALKSLLKSPKNYETSLSSSAACATSVSHARFGLNGDFFTSFFIGSVFGGGGGATGDFFTISTFGSTFSAFGVIGGTFGINCFGGGVSCFGDRIGERGFGVATTGTVGSVFGRFFSG